VHAPGSSNREPKTTELDPAPGQAATIVGQPGFTLSRESRKGCGCAISKSAGRYERREACAIK
jgi:hypothetical protein